MASIEAKHRLLIQGMFKRGEITVEQFYYGVCNHGGFATTLEVDAWFSRYYPIAFKELLKMNIIRPLSFNIPPTTKIPIPTIPDANYRKYYLNLLRKRKIDEKTCKELLLKHGDFSSSIAVDIWLSEHSLALTRREVKELKQRDNIGDMRKALKTMTEKDLAEIFKPR